ncbi:MAG: dTDP-4-dehydrorhamnose reductase [Lachnospiraceae bacterium]|nr:dTDP-4-dehydrorhamnose reductase [Lachnospiraceae bacterium XPB1003]
MSEKVVVTGCNGQLGRALKIELGKDDRFEYIGTDVDQVDITKSDELIAYIRDINPYAVVNCAAYTNVDGCEKNEDLAMKINAIGPRNLAVAAREVGAKLVHISTDYVFPGNGTSPYKEFDATSPKSAYGRTKLAGENFVKDFSDKYFMIRTAWLYGDGKNFVKTMLALSEKHDTIGVVDDQLGNPTSASELARAIHELLPTNEYGLYHGTCEGICSWADFTEEIFKLAGRKTAVEHISSEEYKRRFPDSASRPAYSALDNYMFRLNTDIRFKDWHDAIRDYIEEMKYNI